MDAIETRARKLLDTELRKLGLDEDAYHVGCGADLDRNDQAAINAITAALMLGRPVDLLDQCGAGGVQPKELDVVPSSALGADEAGSVGINHVAGGLPRDVELAEVASEHGVGVRPEDDNGATALAVLDSAYALLTSQVWDPLLPVDMDDAEEFRKARNMIAEAFAGLTQPEGYVLVPVELVKAIEDLSLIYEAGGDIDSKLSEVEAMLAAPPEVKP